MHHLTSFAASQVKTRLKSQALQHVLVPQGASAFVVPTPAEIRKQRLARRARAGAEKGRLDSTRRPRAACCGRSGGLPRRAGGRGERSPSRPGAGRSRKLAAARTCPPPAWRRPPASSGARRPGAAPVERSPEHDQGAPVHIDIRYNIYI